MTIDDDFARPEWPCKIRGARAFWQARVRAGSDGASRSQNHEIPFRSAVSIEIALSFHSVFGYLCMLVGLSTEVDVLALSGLALVAFLAFPTDRPRFSSSGIRPGV